MDLFCTTDILPSLPSYTETEEIGLVLGVHYSKVHLSLEWRQGSCRDCSVGEGLSISHVGEMDGGVFYILPFPHIQVLGI